MHIDVYLRTTVTIDDKLFATAQQLSGLRDECAVIHAALQALIARESLDAWRHWEGTERVMQPITRRRMRLGREFLL